MFGRVGKDEERLSKPYIHKVRYMVPGGALSVHYTLLQQICNKFTLYFMDVLSCPNTLVPMKTRAELPRKEERDKEMLGED